MNVGMVVPGGVDRSGSRRVIPHLVELIGTLAARHDLRVVALAQEPEPGRWPLAGAEVLNVGARPRRLRALALLAEQHRHRPFDVLHGFALVPQGAVAAVAGRLLGVPWVVEAPGGEFAALPDIDFGGWRRPGGRAWIRLACRGARACVVPSHAGVRLAERRGVRAVRIPLPLSSRAWPMEPARARSGTARLAWVGSLNRVKDPALALAAAAVLRARGLDFHLDVVGEDFLGGAAHRRARALGLAESVAFRGFLDQPALRGLLAEATLLLVTSRFEGASRVVLEAASLGVPTVGTEVGHVAEWSPDAARVAAPTPEALADAVAEVLADEERRRALARNAQMRLHEHDGERVAARWEGLYRTAVEGGDADA